MCAYNEPMDASEFSSQHRGLAQQFIDASARLDQIVGAFTAEQLARRPDPKRWSASEAIAHLNATNSGYILLLESALHNAKPRSDDRPYNLGFLGRLFVGSMEPPVKRRFPAPKKFLPPQGDLGNVVGEFRAIQQKLLSLLRQHDQSDLASVSLPSPATRLIRFNAAAAFALLAAHERRHLWQAEQTLKSL